MPVYNAEPYVGQAIESVLGQTLGHLEILAVDDGSTDGSLAVIRQFAARDPRVRVISRPNTGIARALNDALAAAHGEFVARVDSDDTALPERLERQVDYLRSHPDVVCVGCMAQAIDSDGDPLCPWILPNLDHEAIDRANLAGQQAIIGPSMMAPRAAVAAIGGFCSDLEISEDLDLFLRLAETGGRLANLPDVLMGYRRLASSITHTKQNRTIEQTRHVVQQARLRRGLTDPGPPPRAPMRTPQTPIDFHRQWSWMALRGQNHRVARKHARKVLAARPLDLSSWRLAYSVFLRGH
jgi:glycosyltransferase involved in cell wall biosynthesis